MRNAMTMALKAANAQATARRAGPRFSELSAVVLLIVGVEKMRGKAKPTRVRHEEKAHVSCRLYEAAGRGSTCRMSRPR
jgi:hypothetical protein